MSITLVKSFGLGILMAGLLVATAPMKVHADGLQIRPLMYRQAIKAGETKRGYVDVSNAAHTPVTVVLNVRSFRQTDSRGNLEFFDSDTAKAGIRLDLTQIDLGPSEAARVYFGIDSTKLPAGQTFAAIFAATQVETSSGAAPAAQVGTLLLIDNGAGGPHKATVTQLSAPPVSLNSSLQAMAAIRNTGPAKASSAFFPQISVSIGPWWGASSQFEGPLVFSGITRNVPVTLETDHRIGLYKLTVATQGGKQERWVFLLTGIWQWIMGIFVVIISTLLLLPKFGYTIKLKSTKNQKGSK